jgi:hypothetical protein
MTPKFARQYTGSAWVLSRNSLNDLPSTSPRPYRRASMSLSDSFSGLASRPASTQYPSLILNGSGPPLPTAAARPAGCGGMLSKGVYKRRKPSVPVGRGASLPLQSEGPSADGRGTGRAHDERGAERSCCVGAGIHQIDFDSIGSQRDIGARDTD